MMLNISSTLNVCNCRRILEWELREGSAEVGVESRTKIISWINSRWWNRGATLTRADSSSNSCILIKIDADGGGSYARTRSREGGQLKRSNMAHSRRPPRLGAGRGGSVLWRPWCLCLCLYVYLYVSLYRRVCTARSPFAFLFCWHAVWVAVISVYGHVVSCLILCVAAMHIRFKNNSFVSWVLETST